MRRKTVWMLAVLGAVWAGAAAQAATITFGEVATGTTDPTIAGVSFWAGSPAVFSDTLVDDSWSPGANYLMSGTDDVSPGLYDTFIGASIGGGDAFTSVTLGILWEELIPDSTTFWLIALSGGTAVGSASLAVADNAYHTMTVSAAGGFDTLYIYDDLDASGAGTPFHIDNFTFTKYDGGTGVIPEPSTLLLLGSGLLGGAFWGRKKRA